MNRVALSFSGGKDSCLALHHLLKQNFNVTTLITTVMEDETVAHSEPLGKVTGQAKQLGIPIEFIETNFDTYHDDFIAKLKSLKQREMIDTIAFGDIYLTGHREWGEKIANTAGLEPYYPIWSKRENVVSLLEEFIQLGYRAEIIKVDTEKLPKAWVGRVLDRSFIEDIVQLEDVCPMGESGEYHTFVYDGPLFQRPVTHKI